MSDDNFLNIFLNRLGQIFLLNLVFILSSIPIFTIGASLTALYQCTLKIIKNTDEHILKIYFNALKVYFKQSTLTYIMLILSAFIMTNNVNFLININGGIFAKILLYLNVFLGCIWIVLSVYIFPVIATFENTLIKLVKNSIIFALTHIISTIVILIITFFPIALTYVDSALLPLYSFCWFFFGFAVIAYLNSFIFYKIFVPYIK
ncbi:hypothetical protein AN396_09790 [Candidatus Epulonipiscium fishelsonii]|uniref:Uncharacterized protein n=1 Tax=Candidatus Epulonipiscium fishelsonii TaxID=77094 RepID=A0ACC8X9Q1_9FIRM|nr:hypothetical protein AN396_09790 [Epulopiscium sp. SCG-B11WGA-EpuloA1]